MSLLKISLFGPGQILLSSQVEAKIRSRKEFALLVYLAVGHDRTHSRETLMGLFWPELDQNQARNNLRVSLTRLRKAVDLSEPPLILANRHTVRFDSVQLELGGSAWLDVAELNRLLTVVASHAHEYPTQCPTCLADMTKAADLYHGEFLQGFHLDGCEAFEHWLLVQRERFHMQIMDLLPRLEAAHMAAENWKVAEKTVRQRLSLDPLDEDAHRTLMQILALSGLRNAALSHYETCVQLLDKELGVAPNEKTVALVAQIREGNLRLTIDDLRLSSVHPLTPPPLQIVNLKSSIGNSDPYPILSRLEPLPDQILFGVDVALAKVGAALDAEGRSWLVSIEGIGGLGKTTLANALVKQMLDRAQGNLTQEKRVKEESAQANVASEKPYEPRFWDIAWVSAKQEEYLPERGVQPTSKPALDEISLMDQLLAQFSPGPYPTGNEMEKRLALTQLLKEKPLLVVIDNLETSVDYQVILPLLRHLANPSKFLITSRMSLGGQGDIFCYSLSELSEKDALAFLRHEAESRGMDALAATDDQPLQAIYATVGGNPLALKLVLGQLHFLPLDQVLKSLRQASSERTTELYTYIYRQAWQMLDTTSRHLLLCLPVVPNATFDQLLSISGLSREALQRSLMSLCSFSLIELGGDLTNRRYRLHRLTETFLMQEVVKWQETSGQGGRLTEIKATEEAAYFIQRVLYMVEQWNQSEAVQEVDVAILEHEYESVVKAISLGLALEERWATVKPLIIAFTPFMERRGHWYTWHSILERAIKAAHTAQDLDGEITLTSLLARLCQRESRLDDVVYYYRRAIRMARRSGNRYEEARACSNLGYAYIDKGRWWRSEVLSCHALKIFEELGSEHGRAHTHNHLGLLYTRRNQWETAQSNLMLATKIWERNQDDHSLMYSYLNLGLMFVEMGKAESALEHLFNAYRITEVTGELSSSARIWNNIGAAYRLKADWRNANKYANKAESLFRENGEFSGLANVWHNLGLIAYAEGKYETARAYLEESLKTYQILKNQTYANSVKQDIERVTLLLETNNNVTLG